MVVATAAIGGFLMIVGLEYVLESRDTYKADMTKGHGDFPALAVGNTTTSYQPDGFHLVIGAGGGFRETGVRAPKSYDSAEVTAQVTQVSSPAGAGFGPWCYDDSRNGYGLALAADGEVTVTGMLDGYRTIVSSGQTAGWRPGQSRTLRIVCRIKGDRADIMGYVDGSLATTVLADHSDIPSIEITGVAGSVPTASTGPGEWILTTFTRRLPR